MHVHAALDVEVVALDVPRHGGRAGFGSLLEGDGARDLGVSTENGDWHA